MAMNPSGGEIRGIAGVVRKGSTTMGSKKRRKAPFKTPSKSGTPKSYPDCSGCEGY